MAAICWAMEGIKWGLFLSKRFTELGEYVCMSVRPSLWALTELHSHIHSHSCVCIHTHISTYTYEVTYVGIHARADTYKHAYMRRNFLGISERQNLPTPAMVCFFFFFPPMTHVIYRCYVTGLICILLYRLCVILYIYKGIVICKRSIVVWKRGIVVCRRSIVVCKQYLDYLIS